MAQGYKDFTAGAVLTAADLEDYNQNQSIMRFASAATRDTALSVVKTEGMLAYLIDVNTLTVYSGAAWSTIGPVHGTLTVWTPTVGQGVGVAATVTYAAYSRVGRMVWFALSVSCTGTGTGANAVTVTLPVTAASSNQHVPIGQGYIYDNSANLLYTGTAVPASTTALKLTLGNYNGVAYNFQGLASFVAALTTSDIISVTGIYEAAADA